MKKAVCMCMSVMLMLAMLVGCGNTVTPYQDEVSNGKVVVNIEGTVSAVNGNEVTLDNGKVLVISENTVFAGDPDTNATVNDKIEVGNFIQGYTSDDTSADKVSVTKVYSNVAPMRTGGKIAINFEGTVVSENGNSVTLDNGKTIIINENTVITDVNGTVENAVFAEGNHIQGYTADASDSAEATATRIHIIEITH